MIEIETYYLIDYENVHNEGLDGCDNLSEHDHIVIFYTKHAEIKDKEIDYGKAHLEKENVPAGKQSVDMHIVSYLGYLVGKCKKECNVVIVSKDKHFDNVIKFWTRKTKIKVSKRSQIKKIKFKPPVKKRSSSASKGTAASGKKNTDFNQRVNGNEYMHRNVYNAPETSPIRVKDDDKKIKTKSKILRILKEEGCPNDISLYVALTVAKNLDKENGREQIYNAIISKYGQEKGSEIYSHVKKCI